MLADMIFVRKSIRKFEPGPLDEGTLGVLWERIGQVVALFPDVAYEMRILSCKEVGASIKAPHYLVFYAEAKEERYFQCGFVMQQMDLTLCEMGLGSCWVGMGKPIADLREIDGKSAVMVLAFGQGIGPLQRTNSQEFRRKPLEKVSNLTDRRMEAVRVAPSSMNSQPWFFHGEEDGTVQVFANRHPFIGFITGKLNQADVGIALCHFHLVAESMGQTVTYEKTPVEAPKGLDYVITARTK